MKIAICAGNSLIAKAFLSGLDGLIGAGVVELVGTDPLRSGSFDAIIIPGNSLGAIDQGTAGAILSGMSWAAKRRLSRHIYRQYLGSQPIGTAFITGAHMDNFTWAIHAPIRKYPQDTIGHDAVFSFCRAALLALHHHNQNSQNPVSSVLIPDMSMATWLDMQDYAEQVCEAIKSVVEHGAYGNP